MLSLRDCFTMARKIYPRYYPYSFFEYGHYCYLHLRPRRRNLKIARDEYHRVDRFTGKMSGIIDMEDLPGNPVYGLPPEWETLVSDYERDHPDQYGRRSPLDCLARTVNRLKSRLQGRRFGKTGKNKITLHIWRETE